MFCSKCGKEIDDEAVVCPNCGCATEKMNQPANEIYKDYTQELAPAKKIGIASLIFSVIPLIGIILGIIGCIKVKKITNENSINMNNVQVQKVRRLSIDGIVLSILIYTVLPFFVEWLTQWASQNMR